MSEGWAFHRGIPVKQEEHAWVPVMGTQEWLAYLKSKEASRELVPEPCI